MLRKRVLVIALGALTSACGSGPSPNAGGSKPLSAGLVLSPGGPPPSWAAAISTFVVAVPWRDLQPAPGNALPAHTAIDDAISTAQQLQRPLGSSRRMQVILEVLTGIDAPDWAKRLGGVPLSQPTFAGPSIAQSQARWWTSEYGAAYADLQAKLASRYDAIPEVIAVVMTGCRTTDETLPTAPATLSAATAAGWTSDLQTRCVEREAAAHKPWSGTSSILPIEVSLDTTIPNSDLSELLSRCQQHLGLRCVPEVAAAAAAGPPAQDSLMTALRSTAVPFRVANSRAASGLLLPSLINHELLSGTSAIVISLPQANQLGAGAAVDADAGLRRASAGGRPQSPGGGSQVHPTEPPRPPSSSSSRPPTPYPGLTGGEPSATP